MGKVLGYRNALHAIPGGFDSHLLHQRVISMIEIVRSIGHNEQFIYVRTTKGQPVNGVYFDYDLVVYPVDTKLHVDIEGERKSIIPVNEVTIE